MESPPTRSKRVPKYQQIAKAILREMEEQERDGIRLGKTQLDWAEQFKANRQTVRHALDWLDRQGKIQHLSGKDYAPRPTPPNVESEERGTPKIGFPLWAHSLAELKVAKIESRLNLAQVLHSELASFGLELDIQCVGPQRKPDLEKIARLCREWKGVFLEPLDGESRLASNHPFAPLRERTVIVGTLQDEHYNSVCPDLYSAAQMAIEELLRSGARKILFTGRRDEPVSHRFLRVVGAEKALERYQGVELLFTEDAFTTEQVFSEVKSFFLSGGKCDSILASTSYGAAGALRAMADLGIRVPDDVQLIGLGQTSLTAYMVPMPTVVRTEEGKTGREAAWMMENLLRTGARPQPNILIPMHLIRGETTRNGSAPAVHSPLPSKAPAQIKAAEAAAFSH